MCYFRIVFIYIGQCRDDVLLIGIVFVLMMWRFKISSILCILLHLTWTDILPISAFYRSEITLNSFALLGSEDSVWYWIDVNHKHLFVVCFGTAVDGEQANSSCSHPVWSWGKRRSTSTSWSSAMLIQESRQPLAISSINVEGLIKGPLRSLRKRLLRYVRLKDFCFWTWSQIAFSFCDGL